MQNITNIYVTQWRVFAPDVVPYRHVVTAHGTSFLKQALGFRDVTWTQDTFDYMFQDGSLPGETGASVPISFVSFNDRRIAIQVLGDSAAAQAVYATVRDALAVLEPAFANTKPLTFTEETSCVAQLDFEWQALLNPELVDRVGRLVRDLSTEEMTKAIKGVSIRFTLRTSTDDERLKGYGVVLNDQTVAVEPRADVPLSERTYFTYSPGDSETHFRLLGELEAKLSARTPRRSRRP